jgi:hypothetical protein
MIKIFRKIRQHLLSENKFSKYLLYAIGEIILVVIGILIALQINNWNEEKKENNTTSILAISLIDDLQKDKAFLTNAIAFSEIKIKNCDTLLQLLSVSQKNWEIESIYKKINIVGQSNPFFPTTGTYQQIVTSGNLKSFEQLIANKLNAYDMQLKKIKYWADAEDETLWLFANIIWKGMSMQAIADLRFNESKNRDMFMQIPESSTTELINLVSAVKTYRIKTSIEYQEQLSQAENLINSLQKNYPLINSSND